MVDKIVNFIIGIFGASSGAMIGKYITVFVISLMPILELRGGLIAASLLKVPPVPAYIISIIGNLIPIPLILWFLDSVFAFMKKHKILVKFSGTYSKKLAQDLTESIATHKVTMHANIIPLNTSIVIIFNSSLS